MKMFVAPTIYVNLMPVAHLSLEIEQHQNFIITRSRNVIITYAYIPCTFAIHKSVTVTDAIAESIEKDQTKIIKLIRI